MLDIWFATNNLIFTFDNWTKLIRLDGIRILTWIIIYVLVKRIVRVIKQFYIFDFPWKVHSLLYNNCSHILGLISYSNYWGWYCCLSDKDLMSCMIMFICVCVWARGKSNIKWYTSRSYNAIHIKMIKLKLSPVSYS